MTNGVVAWWDESILLPRVDELTRRFTKDDKVLPVAHPEWFREGDIVRVGDEDRYDTGEREPWENDPDWNEGPRLSYEDAIKSWAFEVCRVRNEAVRVVSVPDMEIERPIGTNVRQTKKRGEVVFITAGKYPTSAPVTLERHRG